MAGVVNMILMAVDVFDDFILDRFLGRCPIALVHLGFDGSGLSPTSVTRMTESWREEYCAWSKRDLTGKRYLYVWADGIYFGCRLTDDRPCVLVLMGATEDGKKELIAMIDGQRESEPS